MNTVHVEQFHFSGTSDDCNYMQFIGHNCKTYQGGNRLECRTNCDQKLKVYYV